MKSMMSPDAMNYLRTWQKNFINKKFCPKHVTGSEHNLWFVNCCTGSGKSNVGFETVIQNILFNESLGRKSISVFIAPTIMLSDQIKKDCVKYFEKYYPNLKDKVDFSVFNCESTDNRINLARPIYWADNPKVRHYVVSYCYDSFFGNETIGNRYNAIYNGLVATTSGKDIVCGTIVFDEAHNYGSKWDEITGHTATSSTNINPTTKDVNILTKLFSDVVCMTGTPNVYQCWMSQDERWAKDYVVSVNYATAMKNGWIVSPDVFVIMVNDVKTGLEDAAITALTHERSINAAKIRGVSNVAPHMLVNAPDINTANNVGKNLWKFYDGEVGVSILHSTKKVANTGRGQNKFLNLTAEIDGKEMGSKDAKKSIMEIDTTDVGKERIVTQVEMISEGINVNSFDCSLLTSHSEVNNIQQIGRTLRNFTGKNHASLYSVAENQEDVSQLVSDLVDQGLDLEEVLKKMKIVDRRGTDKDEDPDSIADYEESSWRGYTQVEIRSLMNAMNGATVEARNKTHLKKHTAAIDIIYNLISAIKVSAPTKSKKSSGKGGKTTGKSGGSGAAKVVKGEKKESSPLSKKNAILRRIEDRITKSPDWRNLYIPNMGMNKVINYMLDDLCGIGVAPTLTSEQAAVLRDFISQVNIEMQQAEAARQN